MQLRTETFNVTNTPVVNNPGNNASTPSRSAGGTITNLNGLRSITSVQATERQIRCAPKLFF